MLSRNIANDSNKNLAPIPKIRTSTERQIYFGAPEARWERLKQNARRMEIGQIVDEAMEALERENPSLKGVLPKDYARPALDKQRLGQLIDLITNIRLEGEEARSKDLLGRVYEYFLGQVA